MAAEAVERRLAAILGGRDCRLQPTCRARRGRQDCPRPRGMWMRRRDLIALGLGAAAWPCSTGAQQKAMPLIGLLSPLTPADTEPWHQAFRQGLGDLGWVAGAN